MADSAEETIVVARLPVHTTLEERKGVVSLDDLMELPVGGLPELAVPAEENKSGAAPECPICLVFLCEPLTIGCRHSFCRVCLLESTRLSPAGRACPLCRAAVDIRNPADHPVDQELEDSVLAVTSREEYETRRLCCKLRLAELQRRADEHLPIFFMYPGSPVGAPVALHFFEPRYKILIRRAWEGRRQFVFCSQRPQPGTKGVVVQVSQAQFLPDGRANVVGRAVRSVVLKDVWVEDDTGGLFYTSIVPESAGGRSSPRVVPHPVEVSEGAEGGPRSRPFVGSPKCGCAIS
mmetsp:Transcript_149921/g.481707  ORF Transcript_149921/g.481707 Transcript_149921/m.481707 type:complete len:292 (+) Transcript_149921:75-950(+)|eukprot:CAMPEP_0203862306 /NCGR_PEP_ID=MMETSP0359-20131031/13512_1 /ASSEMBLY_ACC=CAM_ASM_000338 /TAXON_ID=268821 /ORGANISM="Scrippsiella Hangoei, Strain SHTV-5" /LENGTH=291 /DNA_ID=CAMNT_0050779675 /DNA_START=69 /DNA_END=944 /DNA_ORIENTATION=+